MMLCLFFVFVLTDYQFAFKPVNAVQHHQTAVNDLQGRLRRSVEGLQCQLPPPLHNGVFKPSHRRCNPPHNSSSYCRMEPYAQVAPDTPVYYECNPGYSLNTKQGVTNKKSASICRNGQWSPEFPTCVESHHNSNNLPQFQSTSSYCGKPAKLSRAKRNADGTVSRKGAWPWMAIFGTRTNSTQNSGIHWFCAGTLVTTRHILTSAHCFADYRRRNSFFVRFNDIDLDSASDNVGILDIEIQRNNIIIHPGFKEEKIFSHNLAIIKLNTDLPITDYIRPACLPTPDFADKTFDNQTVYFTSWGQTDNDREWNRKRRYQPILKEYQASIVNLIECNHNYRGYQSDDFVIIGWDLLCASVPDNIRCKGDAGSPLMLKVKDTYVVMGVVATQFRCYDELYPRLFTRLSMYMDWIIANLKI